MSASTRRVLPVVDYPLRPVRLIEPFGAGGGPDLLARALATRLAGLWAQSVTVENHPGAGSTVAPALVAASSPDGYTLLINTSAQAYSAAVSAHLPYDPLKDFAPVAPLTSQPYVLVTGESAGIQSIGQLVSAAKGSPGRLKFGSTGVGTGTHLGVEQFNQAAGIAVLHFPARPGDANADVIARTVAGETTFMLAPIQLALPDIHHGRLVPIGVSTSRRSSLLPDVPTIAEAGVPGFDFPIWYGVWAPAGTPEEVLAKIAGDLSHLLSTAEFRDWLATHGAEAMNMDQAEFARFVVAESKKAVRIITASAANEQ
jgi:tripartite-type tricarboxylate transporter receptor subunit TctC